MAAPTKLTFIFEGPKAGWTESWYLPLDASSNAAAVVSATAKFVNARTPGLAKNCSVTDVRISMPDKSTPAYLTSYPQAGEGFNQPIGGTINVVNDCAFLRVVGATTKRSRGVTLRGFPDSGIRSVVGEGSTFSQDGDNFLKAFVKAVSKAGFQFRYQLAPGAGGVVRTPISGISVDVGTGYLICTAVGSNFQTGDLVAIQRVGPTDLNRLNGQHKVIRNGVDQFLVPLKAGFTSPSAYQGKGSVFLVKYGYDAILEDYTNARPSTRNTGRPLGSRRGRRKASR